MKKTINSNYPIIYVPDVAHHDCLIQNKCVLKAITDDLKETGYVSQDGNGVVIRCFSEMPKEQI